MNLKWFLGAGLIVLVLAVPSTAAPPPNVVLILADDLGWSDLSCCGSTFYETPAIDRLAAQGMRFDQAYAAANVCSPTRASIMTGKYPARLHTTNFGSYYRRSSPRSFWSSLTIPS
jgi:arylsulfatase A-like enzyme